MATFATPLDSLLFSIPSDTFWASSNNIDSPPATSQDGSEFKLDPTWQSAIYNTPDIYCLPPDNWSNQCTTPLSSFSPPNNAAPMPSYPDNRIDVTNWATPLDPGPFTTAPVSSAASIATPCTPDLNLTAQGTLQDYTTAQPYTATLPSNHSSPSISEPSLPDHIIPTNPSVNAKMKPNRATKAPIRCWEHSCGGRAFSSLGNYERHLREKSGRAKSFTCEQCGQRFTRSTAKNKHIRYGRCRVRPLIQ